MAIEEVCEPVPATGQSAEPAGTDRRLVLKSSLATLAAIGATGVSTLAQAQNAPKMIGDVAILNFALNLEYLEAEFYLRAVFGQGLAAGETTGRGKQGTVTGGSAVPFQNQDLRAYAREIAQDEHKHVDFLRAALGKHTVAEPSIDLQNSFNLLAQAAGLGDTFDPFANETNFLLGAFIFEDVGVTAYHGAAPLLSNKTYLDAAAGILAVEAYHAGIVRLLCYQAGLTEQCNAISNLRDKLSRQGGSSRGTDQGIVYDGKVNLVPADRYGVAFERNPDEVLKIVYAGGKRGNFGFFPDKVNGPIH